MLAFISVSPFSPCIAASSLFTEDYYSSNGKLYIYKRGRRKRRKVRLSHGLNCPSQLLVGRSEEEETAAVSCLPSL